VQRPAFLRLLGLLGTPTSVGVENPTLEHFGRLPSGGGVVLAGDTLQPPPSSPVAPAPHGGAPVLPLVIVLSFLALVAAVATSVRARRAGRVLLARATEIIAVPLLLALGGSLAAVPLTSTSAAVRAPALPTARPTAAPTVAPVASVTPKTINDPVLAQLVSLENQMSSDELRIRALTAVIDDGATASVAAPAATTTPASTASAPTAAGATTPVATPASATTPAAPPRGPFDEGTDPLGTAHQLALSLEATQQAEYNLFLSVATDPAQTAALVAAAADAPLPVRQAVAYNVQAVQAQLAQEAAIAQAAKNDVDQAAAPKTLLAPLQGPVTQPFGPSTLVVEPPQTFNGVTYPHFHTGVDIAGPLDAPIRAAADGVVALAGAETDGQGHLVGYGNYVVIAHAGKMITLYGHLDQLLVKPGQPVHAGDVIGLEGSSGNSTGPHLHFEVRVAGLLADPAPYFGRQLTTS
jgi:murein DD-endopeptidase MepM/ murein hydrolase activator NlpD